MLLGVWLICYGLAVIFPIPWPMSILLGVLAIVAGVLLLVNRRPLAGP